MRASSIGLEVFVRLKEKEISILKNSPIIGDFNFRDNMGTPNRKIPFEIHHKSEQRESLIVTTEPSEVYFGLINKAIFCINHELYEEIKNHGISGDRFYTGGKLTIVSEEKYTCY